MSREHDSDSGCWCDWTQEQLRADLAKRLREAGILGMTPEQAKPITLRVVTIFELEHHYALTHEYAARMYDEAKGARSWWSV